jgi:hypothetical protein
VEKRKEKHIRKHENIKSKKGAKNKLDKQKKGVGIY